MGKVRIRRVVHNILVLNATIRTRTQARVVAFRLITWPLGEQLRKVTDGFESKWEIPQVCGAIDVTHIEVDLLGHRKVH